MNQKNTECPFCGSKNLIKEEVSTVEKIPFSNDFHHSKVNYKCKTCHEEGDFFDENDEKYLEEFKEAKNLSVINIIENLSYKGYSMSYIERAFELPARTLNQWKQNKSCSASGVALMRIIALFPWITEVADENFDKGFSDKKIIYEAACLLNNYCQQNNYIVSAHIIDSTNSLTSSGSNSDQTISLKMEGVYCEDN